MMTTDTYGEDFFEVAGYELRLTMRLWPPLNLNLKYIPIDVSAFQSLFFKSVI